MTAVNAIVNSREIIENKLTIGESSVLFWIHCDSYSDATLNLR